MSAIETRQLFNFIQGSDISGVSSYDIWKSLNPNGTEAEFLEYIRSGPQGEQGPEGPQGSSARVYFLMCSDNVIERTIHDTLLPSSITFNAYYREGTNTAKINYTGRFIIQETTDGYTWTNKYTSNVDESSVNFIPSSAEVKFIKCKLYAAGGTTEELDVQNIPILTDAGLIKVLVATLSNEAHTISCDYNGENCNYEGCNTQVKVYSGVTEVTQSATFNINTSKGVTGAWDENIHVYTITDLSVENGYVDFEITFGGNSIVKRFTVAKIKAGANGEPGSSTYDIWVSSGHEGDVNDFLEFLKGEPGPKGQSTYEVWTGLGNTGTAQEFIEFLKGEPGEAGPQGEPGSSTYDIWVSSGHEGDVNDFLEFLKGKDGTSVTILGTKNTESELPIEGNNNGNGYIINGDLFVWGSDGWTNVGQVRGPQGEQGPEGPQGPKGQSTYDIWKSIEGNEDGTVQDFLNYLKDDGESNVSEETLAQIEKNKEDISQLTQEIADQQTQINLKQPKGNYALKEEIPNVPVQSVNGKTGAVVLGASDVGATTESWVQAKINDLKAQGIQQVPLFANSKAECTDTTKMYVLPDGYIYAYEETRVEGGQPLFTNKLPTAINKDGTPYNGGKGYKSGYRVNSSNNEVEATNRCCTGFIPVNYNDTVRIKNIYSPTDTTGKNGYIGFYSSDFTTRVGRGYEDGLIPEDGSEVVFVPSNLKGFNSSNTNATSATVYMRISSGVIDGNSIVTINEEIKYSEASTTQDWVNTGRAFVPADYEDRIVELENEVERIDDIDERVSNIENGISTYTDAEVLEHIRNWDSPIYDNIPVYQLNTEKSALTEADKTVSAVYAKYDALMAQHSDFITKTDLGLCSDGVTHIYRYDFKEAEPHRYTKYDWSETKPTIIIVSGIHREWAGIYSLFHALEEIATNSDLAEIRRNMHFIVLPVANPYALIGDYSATVYRKNYNGVEIHRNFEVGHTVVDSTEKYYGGQAPLTEVETQIINNIMAANPHASYFLSCHSYDRDAWYGTGFMWASTGTKYMCNLGYRLIDKMSKMWHEKYGATWETGCVRENNAILADPTTYPNAYTLANGDYRAGVATVTETPGAEQRQATKYGIQALNLEVCDTFWVLDSTMYSSKVLTHGAEVYINFFLTAMSLYDPKYKGEYFKG